MDLEWEEEGDKEEGHKQITYVTSRDTAAR